MQLKNIIKVIVLILTFTAQQINAKPRRVSIDEINQLIKPDIQKIKKKSRLRTLLSQDSVDEMFSWISAKSQSSVQLRVQGSRTRESRRKFRAFVQCL